MHRITQDTHVLRRRLGAVVLGAIIATALTVAWSARADAATTRVELVNQHNGRVLSVKPNYAGIPPGSVGLSTSAPNITSRVWDKEDFGSGAIYHPGNPGNAGKCLTASTSSNAVTVQPCNHGFNQIWSQGLSGGAFRELRNLKTSRSLTGHDPQQFISGFTNVTDQQFFVGDDYQLWQVRPL